MLTVYGCVPLSEFFSYNKALQFTELVRLALQD